jgi:hypothetical protein
MKTALASFLLVAALLVGCSSEVDHEYIRTRTWIWESGYQVGTTAGLDFIDGNSELKGDTIYQDGAPMAIITALYKTDNMIHIKSMGGEEGKYLDHVEYTR